MVTGPTVTIEPVPLHVEHGSLQEATRKSARAIKRDIAILIVFFTQSSFGVNSF